MTEQAIDKPLAGIKLVELAPILAGRWAGRLLAEVADGAGPRPGSTEAPKATNR